MKKLVSILLFALSIFALEYFFTHENIVGKSAAVKSEPQVETSQTVQKTQIQKTAPEATGDVEEQMRNFFSDIPNVSELRDLTDSEVHEIPEPVRIAGESLAEMRKFFVEHPQPAVVEMRFYLKCSTDRDLFDSVRAICAARVSQKYTDLTGRKISPQLFDRRIAGLKERVTL